MPTSPGCSDPRISKRCLRATTTIEIITINRNKMEQINSPIRDRQSESNLPVAMQQLSPDVLQKTMLVRQNYGSRSEFITKLNPSTQLAVGRMGDQAHFDGSPSLAILRKTYGEGFPTTWLLPQIFDLVVYSNSKGTLNEQQAEFLAEAIAQEYFFLTSSELLLFFYRFKLGKYGHFYGTVDPMRITQALNEFCDERVHAIAKREKEEEKRRHAKESKNAKPINCEEYCRLKGYPTMHSVHEIIFHEMAREAEEAAKVKPPTD